MDLKCVIEGRNITKNFRGFELDIPMLQIPQGFATALIGENGAGKTTLMNILAGIRLDYKGDIRYFNTYNDKDREDHSQVKEAIGYTGPGAYYLPQWKVKQVEQVSELLFSNFHKDRFENWLKELEVGADTKDLGKKVSSLSDGNRMKLMIAGVLARDTRMLLMDEPASPLDPLMRDKLCDLIREYLLEDEGNRSVFFSTHNIADMENVTDYAISMADGKIAEEGFVENLKEKYVMVKGECKDLACASKILYSIHSNPYGYEGICLAEHLDQMAGCDISMETPTLSQISVAVMKHHKQQEGTR